MLTTMQTTPTQMHQVITQFNPQTFRFITPAAEAQGILNAIRYALYGWWSARDELRAAKQQTAQKLIQLSAGTDGYGLGGGSDMATPTPVLENIQKVEAWEAILCDLTESFKSYAQCLDDDGECLISTQRALLVSELEDRYKLPKCVRECFQMPSATYADTNAAK